MEGSACVHVEKLKQQGGIRDYEKFLLNFCVSCPPHLKETREALKIITTRRIRCKVEFCKNDVGDWKMFACLHCIFFACKEHATQHFIANDPPHSIGCSMSDGSVFCFSCDDYIFDGALEGMRETVQFGQCSTGGNVTHFTKIAKIIKPTALCVDSRSTVGLRGLVNLKNTCYMNCIVQVLAHTPILSDFFLSECFELDCEEMHGEKPCLMACMADIFRKFYNGEKTPLLLTELLAKMWSAAPHLASADQQDAHEFLTAILEGMGRHFVAKMSPCAIEGIFHGTLKSTVKCNKCGSDSVTKEPFMEISLEVFGDSQITLEECLTRYTQIEELGPTHTIDCVSCGMKQESSKQLLLCKIPLILCMHFKRFQNLNRNKWEHLIQFPTHLNLLIYSDDDEPEEVEQEVADEGVPEKIMKVDFKTGINHGIPFRSTTIFAGMDQDFEYSLYAVVSHLGSSEGGHYITYFRNAHDNWFLCDDHVITKASLDHVKSCHAYMLFFHRTQLPQRPKTSY